MEYVKKALPVSLKKAAMVILGIGLFLMLLEFALNPKKAIFNYLILFAFLASVGIGSMFFIAIEHVFNAVWSVPIRRVYEVIASVIPVLVVLAIPIIVGMHSLYHWTHGEALDTILASKAPYLNIPFFLIRIAAILMVWILFYFALSRNSRKQDETSDQSLSAKNAKVSIGFLPVFALSITALAVDLLMSLDPHWFSTMFGVYYFAATILTALATVTIFALKLKEHGYLHPKMKMDTFYNLGTMMNAFTAFWAYIAFSQFMLIWYANMPEETTWYINRTTGSWFYLSVGLIFIRFLIPYFLLLSTNSKKNEERLYFTSVWLLMAHLYELYWLIMPTYAGDINKQSEVFFGFGELSVLFLAVGIMMLVFFMGAKDKNLVAVGDPKLERGLKFRV